MRIMVSALTVVLCTACAANAERLYGITNLQELVTFDSDNRVVTSTVSPVGFSILGESLLSIDVRPATGELYGLTNQSRIFKINPVTGATQLVGGPISPAPTGSLRAIDFNPTVDRIRVLGSGGSVTNLRVHPDTGALAAEDGDHAFAAGDPNAGETPSVVNGAYTNSFLGATTTTLFTLESGNDVLATQVPPNNGTLNTLGALGFDLASSGGFTGFDISGASGTAFLVGNNSAGGGLTANSLYQVNLTTGAATLLGAVAGVNGSFRDIAVSAVPEPASLCLVLLGVIGFAASRRRGR